MHIKRKTCFIKFKMDFCLISLKIFYHALEKFIQIFRRTFDLRFYKKILIWNQKFFLYFNLTAQYNIE